MPKVSVIIPNHNHSEYLRQRIDSVLDQTYTDFELIVLDDCSSDNSKTVIERYRNNEKISHIIYNEQNSGSTFKQWNKGIQLAKGEYIWIAESDDWCEPTLLENLVKGLDENEECVIAYCQSYCITDGQQIKFQSNHTSLGEYVNGRDFISLYILLRNPIFNASMAVWRRKAYTEISGNFMQYKLIGDYYFWMELCTRGDVYICGKLLNYFRQHSANVSFIAAANGQFFKEHIPLLKELLERKIITAADYFLGLKKAYENFKLNENNITVENTAAINKLFSAHTNSKYKLELYFFKKSIRSFSRKLLRL